MPITGDGYTVGNDLNTAEVIAAYPLEIPSDSDPLKYFSAPDKDSAYYQNLLANRDRLEAYKAQLGTDDILGITNNFRHRLEYPLSDELRAMVLDPSLRPNTREGYSKFLRSLGALSKFTTWNINFYTRIKKIFFADDNDKPALEQDLQNYLVLHDNVMRTYSIVGLSAYHLELLKNISCDPYERKLAAGLLFEAYIRLRAEGYSHHILYT